MKKNEIDEIRKQLISKMKILELSGNQTAKVIGISPATISNIINSDEDITKLEKVSETMWQKISIWLDMSNKWRIAPITGYNRVMDICKHAHKMQLSRIICDEPGAGKSFTLKQYARDNAGVYYIECQEHWTTKTFLHKLMHVMGIQVYPGTITDKVDIIVDFLNNRRNTLLIIDEADKLRDKAFIIIKSFYDAARTGIIMSGTPYFEARITKACRLNKMGFKEMYSRFGGEIYHLGNIGLDEVTMICVVNNLRNEKVIRKIAAECNGDLRRVKALFDAYQLIKTKKEKEVA